ncbi:MAG: SLBB domain-containing protein [bacterium]
MGTHYFNAVYAQEKSQTGYHPLEAVSEAGQRPLEGPIEDVLREEKPSFTGQALEGFVDPEFYLLGPGDLLILHIQGGIELDIPARISADGSLRIKTVGLFGCREKTLASLQQEVLPAAQSRYRNSEISLNLVELRSFKASVGGMIWSPGTYTVTAADRAITLLTMAGGFFTTTSLKKEESQAQAPKLSVLETPAEEQFELPEYSARRAQIIHKDGSREPADLLLFLRAGLAEGNPYLRDGDFLLIPPLGSESGFLSIYGAVQQPGEFEFLAGDDLQKALQLAGNLTPEARTDSIEITRFLDHGERFTTIYIDLAKSGSLNTSLQADDRIFVRPKSSFHPRQQVELRGEVQKPGFYPITESQTTLLDVIQQAGGFTPYASLKEATLSRRFKEKPADAEMERLLATPAGELNTLEYDYYKNKGREVADFVSLDLYALCELGDSNQNVFLMDGDALEVQRHSHSVKIMGQVMHPGIISYAAGWKLKDYIEQAGGFASEARRSKIRVIKVNTGLWVKPSHTVIEEGDTIFVPQKPEVNYWMLAKDVILITAQIVTLYFVIDATKSK